MKKVLIYSIQPEHVLNFLKGLKSDEIRKRDLPQWAKDKIDRGEVVEEYGYCTKAEPILCHFNNSYYDTLKDDNTLRVVEKALKLNGKVVVKFQVIGVTQFEFVENNLTVKYDNEAQLLGKVYMLNEQATQLTYEQLFKYIGNNKGYAHHFTNIQPIEPMEIGEFMVWKLDVWYEMTHWIPLKRAPQSFQTAWVKGK